jgi:hypothetical protein
LIVDSVTDQYRDGKSFWVAARYAPRGATIAGPPLTALAIGDLFGD